MTDELPRAVQKTLSATLRQMIHDEVLLAKGPGKHTTRLEATVEKALVWYLLDCGEAPLRECNPKAYIRGFLAGYRP